MEKRPSMACWADAPPVDSDTRLVSAGVSQSRAQEMGGVDEGCLSGNGPSEGATDFLKKEFGDRASKADTTRPIARHWRLFCFDELSA